jgi:transposase
LLKASLLMALYTVRSERMFCEELDYNLLFRWFLDLNWDEPGFDHSSFSRNPARLLRTMWRASFSAPWWRRRAR